MNLDLFRLPLALVHEEAALTVAHPCSQQQASHLQLGISKPPLPFPAVLMLHFGWGKPLAFVTQPRRDRMKTFLWKARKVYLIISCPNTWALAREKARLVSVLHTYSTWCISSVYTMPLYLLYSRLDTPYLSHSVVHDSQNVLRSWVSMGRTQGGDKGESW